MKIIVGTDIGSYTFDASAKTITLTGLSTLVLEQVLLITNATENIPIFNFTAIGMGGSISGNVITLEFNTAAMSDTDRLVIIVDVPSTSVAPPNPTGGATAALQTAGNVSLASIDTKNPALVSGRVPVDGSGVTQPVSAASLPLPSGAATAALQTTGNSSLSSIDGKVPSLGNAVMASSVPVTIASNQTAINVGNITGTVALPTGAATSALQTTGNTSLSSIDTKTPALVSGKVPVDGSGVTQPVSAVSLPLPTGAATAARQDTGNASLASIDGKTLSAGQTTMSASSPVVIASDQTAIPVTLSSDIEIGAVEIKDGTSDTRVVVKTDGTNNALVVTQNTQPLPTGAATAALQSTGNSSVSSIDGKLGTLGQKAMAGSAPVVIASDQSAIPISGTVTATNLSIGTNNASIPLSSTQVGGSDGTLLRPINVDTHGKININNIDGTVTLPTGAATAAKQPALGTAGTPSADVITVQGVTSMTALKVDGSGVTQPVSGTVTANAGSGTFAVSAAALPLPSGAATAAKQPALGTAGTASADVITVQGVASMTALKVDGSAVTQPVSAASLPLPSGASTAAKQPALGTAGTPSADVITVQGVTSMTALKVDGSAVTQPVSGTVTANAGSGTFAASAASLPLPSGASTAAKQPALGTAGTASADVITVQGVASMTALKVDGSAVTQPVSGTVTANIGTSGSLALDATLTGGTQKTKIVDTGGTNVATVSAAGAVKVDGSAVTQPVSGTVSITSNSAVNVAQIAGTATDTNSGTKSAGTIRVVIATDQPQLTNKLLVTPDANSAVNVAQINGVAPSMGVGATGTGVQRVVQANDQGKTLVSTGGSASSSGNNTLVAAGTNKLKVYGFSLSTTSTTAVTCIFQSGAGGTELWRVLLQAPSNVNTGANLIVTPPAYIFATASATLLNLNLSGAQTVHWSVAYFDEA